MKRNKRRLNNKPTIATIEEWDIWRTETKRKYPFRYFLFEILPSFSVFPKRLIDRWYWAFQYRFNPKHQYHIVRTSLKPGYYDIDHVMLYSCMELLNEYVHIEYDSIYWDSDEEHKKISDTIWLIYNWWNYERPEKIKKINNDLKFSSGSKEESISIFKEEAALIKEENEMLTKLVNIRQHLWS